MNRVPSSVAQVARRSPLTTTFGALIKAKRTAAGMSQTELGAVFGTSQQVVCRWERGFAVPELSVVLALADLFAFSVDELRDAARQTREQRQAS